MHEKRKRNVCRRPTPSGVHPDGSTLPYGVEKCVQAETNRYDTLGRLATERGPFGTNTVTATYDEQGRMASVSYGSYSVSYSIDGKGRITGISAPEGGYSFTYSSNGFKRTLVTYPNGVKETRSYDALTRMTNLVYKKWLTTLLSINYRHDNADRRTNEVWSTGWNLNYGYDRAHQLLHVVSTSRASDSASYRYDKAGNPIRRTEMGLGVTNSFNNLNQIVSGIWTGGAVTVAGAVNYAAGTVTVNGVTGRIFPDRVFEATNITVSAGTNVLTAVYHGPAFTNTQMVATNTSTVVVVNPTFGYDAKGNLTNDAEFVYQFDIANRLTNVISKASGSSVLAARYDGLGRRVEVTRNGSTVERYVYFPSSFLVLAVLDGSNVVKEVYTHGPDLSGVVGGAGGIGGILSVSTNISQATARKYFHADAMGNVILVSDTDGTQIAAYGYTPFGNLLNQSGDYQARFLYSSKEHDAETGLTFYGLRYVDTTRGAWISRDILGENMQVNLYAFVDNRPLSDSDHIGLVGEGIITLAEIPGVGSQLNTLHARLLDKAVRVSASSVKKAEFTSWLAKVGPEVFVNLYAQAIYDVLQSRLEDVVRNIGVCYRINVEYAASSSEKGSIAVKEHAFPALTQPWTWTTAPTIERSMKYEPCPDNCFWRVYYYVPTSKDFSTWKEVERFSCSGTSRCRKTL